jgi:hypothetical protein
MTTSFGAHGNSERKSSIAWFAAPGLSVITRCPASGMVIRREEALQPAPWIKRSEGSLSEPVFSGSTIWMILPLKDNRMGLWAFRRNQEFLSRLNGCVLLQIVQTEKLIQSDPVFAGDAVQGVSRANFMNLCLSLRGFFVGRGLGLRLFHLSGQFVEPFG